MQRVTTSRGHTKEGQAKANNENGPKDRVESDAVFDWEGEGAGALPVYPGERHATPWSDFVARGVCAACGC